MNRFVHRIVSSNGGGGGGGPGVGGGVLSRDEFHRQLSKKKLIWFGEFHSEPRIVAFLDETVRSLLGSMERRCRRRKTTTPPPKLHVVMEHFSIEMQGLLDRFQSDPTFGYPELKREYEEIGTEGHGLDPYRGFLLRCKNGAFGLDDGGEPTAGAGAESSEGVGGGEGGSGGAILRLHGGFVPRPCASRWNKAEGADAKRELLEDMYRKDLLPPPTSPLHDGLWSECDNMLFKGSASHFRLIASMMSGEDLYDADAVGAEGEGGEEEVEMGTATPIERLYQAQLLKDHAAAYRLGKLLAAEAGRDDKVLFLAGIGHLKHRLGIPQCLDRYLRAQVLRGDGDGGARALDALLDASKFSALVGPQMLYETEIEDRYKPLEDAIELDGENDDDAYVANKQAALNDLFLNKPKLFDELVLGSDIVQQQMMKYDEGRGNFEHPSCDYCYVYDEDDDNLLCPTSMGEEAGGTDEHSPQLSCPRAEASAAKEETMDAYNSVGESAFRKGNLLKAKVIMKQLGYTDEDMELIGDDCLYNFQGVANPHKEANLQPGEHVLDVGSGLGVDSFLAAARVGAAPSRPPGDAPGGEEERRGTVTGVDLAARQVAHANAAARARGVDDRVVFVRGDAERLSSALAGASPSPSSEGFDACISNGAFCLIPDKERAFREIFRALKPGGRMAVSTTTIRDGNGNDDGGGGASKEWPLCMQMFANLSELKPTCENIGFENVRIADAESPMEMEFSEEVYEAAFGGENDNPERFKIHGKEKYADQYKYLEEMNMDELCKVVTVCATKPRKEE